MESQEQVLSFEGNELLNNFIGTAQRINNQIEKIHGKAAKLNLDAPQGNKHFTFKGKSERLNGRKIRLNSTVPNEELFSVAQELVRPADEPFSARDIFEVDSSFNAGSQEIGYDVECLTLLRMSLIASFTS